MKKKTNDVVNTLVATTKIKAPDYKWADDETMLENSVKYKEYWVDHFFLCALIWTFGSIFNEATKVEFEKWLKRIFE